MGVEIPSLRLSSRFFATRLDAKVLQVRPMGTTNHYISRDRSPALNAKIEHCWAPILSDFREYYQSSDSEMNVVMCKIPTRSDQRQWISQSWVSIKGWSPMDLDSIRHHMSHPAHRLLLVLPVPHQTVRDLAMIHAASQSKVTQPAPKITQFFRREEPGKSWTPWTSPQSLILRNIEE